MISSTKHKKSLWNLRIQNWFVKKLLRRFLGWNFHCSREAKSVSMHLVWSGSTSLTRHWGCKWRPSKPIWDLRGSGDLGCAGRAAWSHFKNVLLLLFAVKLQKCLKDNKTSPKSPSAWGGEDKNYIPVIENINSTLRPLYQYLQEGLLFWSCTRKHHFGFLLPWLMADYSL